MAYVLVVEDEPVLAEVVGRALERAGMAVTLARSCSEARAALAQRTPDLVILDLKLPDGDGLALLRELRRATLPPTVPVIAVTAGFVTRSELRRNGVQAFLPKPYDVRHLLAAVVAAQAA